MKKYFFLVMFVSVVMIVSPAPSSAQGMMGSTQGRSDASLVGDAAQGKLVWEKLLAKQIACVDLSDQNFERLGEYFMAQMMGTSHEAVNAMMTRMFGENGQERMHIAMGKRMSSCDPNATMSQPMMQSGMLPMMNTMMGGGAPVRETAQPSFNASHPLNESSMMGSYAGWPMMGGYFGGLGWIVMILWWALVIAGIVALVRWFTRQSHGAHHHEQSPLEILKERYARSEIDQREFEQKKKDLTV